MDFKEGFYLFPLMPGSKMPYPNLRNEHGKGGFYVATNDPGIIEGWKVRLPNCNWAVRTGIDSKVFVVDVDVKNGAKGAESLNFLLDKSGEDLPETYTVSTPTGGRHYYFRYSREVPNLISAGEYGGIDVKSEGGYVVAPGSTIRNEAGEEVGSYEVTVPADVAECPDWLYDMLIKPHIKQERVGYDADSAEVKDANTGGLSQEDISLMCERFLERYSANASTGNRNDTLLEMLCQIRDCGADMATARFYAKQFHARMGDPQFSLRECMRTLESCYSRPPRAPHPIVSRIQTVREANELELPDYFDQEGVARYIAGKVGRAYLYIVEKGWAAYKNGYWDIEDGFTALYECVVSFLRALNVKVEQEGEKKGKDWAKASKVPLKCSSSNIKAIIEIMENYMSGHIGSFNTHNYLINCRNSVLDLRTLQTYEHAPEYRFTYKLDVEYDPMAKRSLWEKVINETLESPGKVECGMTQLQLFQQAMGYCLTGDSSEERMFYIYGATRSGKGTVINTLYQILGPLAGNISTGVLTTSRAGISDPQNFQLAGLAGKRLVVASETDKDTILDAAKLKSVTGNDDITAAYKFKNPFTYTPHFKIIMSSNHEPTVDATDEAAWGRLIVFRFPYSKSAKADTRLKEKLKEEADGIFSWACQGAKVWYYRKTQGIRLPLTDSMKEYIKSRREELDSVAQFIENDNMVPSPSEEVAEEWAARNDLYLRYLEFCKFNGITKPYGSRVFFSSMRDKGFLEARRRDGGMRRNVFIFDRRQSGKA